MSALSHCDIKIHNNSMSFYYDNVRKQLRHVFKYSKPEQISNNIYDITNRQKQILYIQMHHCQVRRDIIQQASQLSTSKCDTKSYLHKLFVFQPRYTAAWSKYCRHRKKHIGILDILSYRALRGIFIFNCNWTATAKLVLQLHCNRNQFELCNCN